ncbi:DNA methyltransferase [Salinisphaera sp.]|uniref:DNA methyltransferase n=1 Tax=Salinisphaera sp. TaxID=1914330 RepID=UPI002D78E3CA|nr:DNA methyltransferase [Salinisphaera sp.]HET7315621.1 DNA methyltransferase [Salinisphaera sp.]
MSTLSDLLRQVEQKDAQLAADLRREVKALESRRAFGLNFERHVPETVELPGRPVRRGDKVRFVPERGEPAASVERGLWRVKAIRREAGGRVTELIRKGQSGTDAETARRAADDLVVVAEFRDPIYPGLTSTGKVERGGDKPYHSVINAENFHALQALLYTHEGQVDAIYIDPPYNTGAKDWKYNNDYVDGEDAYRHSKWLAFMERRLKLARRLLNPENSVLIVTIDEKEYLRLGLLLQQTFPDSIIQMISSVINPKGTARTTYFSRTDEYAFFVFLGEAGVPEVTSGEKMVEVRWRYLRRTDIESRRGTTKGGTAQFFPIYVDHSSHKIREIGDPLPPDVDRRAVPEVDGCVAVFPIREDGEVEMNWGLTAPSLQRALDAGFVRVSKGKTELQPYIFSYLTAPKIKKIESGKLVKSDRREDGSWIVLLPEGKSARPTTTWRERSHDAGAYGTTLLRELLPDRKFPFPKSLYAVEDTLHFFLTEKPNAAVVDFFTGSGTTAHAVMRLNKQDGGRRQCISVTNNEVSADEQKRLRAQGLRPGDAEWETLGICDYITKPRIEAAITGKTPEGEPIKGDYKFTDEFPMAEGFEENVEFFTLTYEAPRPVAHHKSFPAIAPLLWLRAGARGRRIERAVDDYAVADTYAVLFDLDAAEDFLAALAGAENVNLAFIVTDDDRGFQSVCGDLPERIEAVRLYESYLTNFKINVGTLNTGRD